MTSLVALERFLPPHRYPQSAVSDWVRAWLDEEGSDAARRLLKVYDTAGVDTRASVVKIEQVFAPGDFETQNDLYVEFAKHEGVALARRALKASGLAPAEISLVVSVSCTGFMIPAVDAFVADALGLGPRLARLPITESGCAGGVVGLARAHDFLVAHPRAAALVLAVEFSSLTFQRWDRSTTNVVSSAIFGDGAAAAVLVGAEHPRAGQGGLARIRRTDSFFFPGTTHLMGFRLRNPGLQIVLDRHLAPFVKREVGRTAAEFLRPENLTASDISSWILHPGGRRIVEAMKCELGLTDEQLAPTEAVLREHGNMSSVTVLFVLDEVLRTQKPARGSLGVLGAFGPGFAAEMALVEF